MNRCCIALGANLHRPERAFERAFDQLEQERVRVQHRSGLLRTPAMGADAGPEFLNAAAVLETSRSPHELLALLHDIEDRAGRTRTTIWGPRPLDLDLLLYEDLTSESPELTLPHPLMWFRRFVLQPLTEVARDWRHPVLDVTVGELAERLDERPLVFRFRGLDAIQCEELEHRVATSLTWTLTAAADDDTDRPHNHVFRFVPDTAAETTTPAAAFAVVDLSPATAFGRQPPLERSRCLRPFVEVATGIHANHIAVTQKLLWPQQRERLHAYMRDVLTAVLPAAS